MTIKSALDAVLQNPVVKTVTDAVLNRPHDDSAIIEARADVSNVKQQHEVAVANFNHEMCRIEHGPDCLCWKHTRIADLPH